MFGGGIQILKVEMMGVLKEGRHKISTLAINVISTTVIVFVNMKINDKNVV